MIQQTIKKISLLSLFLCLALLCSAQYKGTVFVDKNENGVRDKGERTLKNICVSDGLNVVKTNSKGQFTLDGHSKAKFIFITTPSGYKTYNKYYQRVESNKEDYSFGVIPFKGRIANNGAHKFVQISDTEIGEEQGHDDWVQNIRDYARNNSTAFVIQTGDICYEGGLKSHIKLMNTKNMDTPMFYCIGNHDLVKGKYGEELFEKLYGPVFYSFDVGNVHYIVTPMLGGDYRPSYTKEDVYRWLKNDLKHQPKGKAIMIFNHDILTFGDSFIYGINDKEYIDLDAHNLKAWIYGHWHNNYILKHKKAFSICTSTPIRGGIDHASSAFRVFDVDSKGDFKTKLRYSYIKNKIDIVSVDNLSAALSEDGKVPVSVNTYSTVSPTSSVIFSCLVDNKPIIRNRKLVQNTDFNWSSEVKIPTKYENKLVTIYAEAKFENGEKTSAEKSFIYKSANNEVKPTTDWCNLLSSPDHIGISKDKLKTPLSLSWVKNVGANIYMCSPIIYKGNLFVATVDEDNEGTAKVVSMNAENGDVRWSYNTKGSIKNSIAITKGVVLAQDIYGYIYALDANSGKLLYSKLLFPSITTSMNDGLVAREGIVYAGTGKGLTALEAKTGKIIWKNKAWGRGEGCTATLSLSNENVLVGSAHWRSLYANDALTGKSLWKNNSSGLRFRSSAAAMIGGNVYIVSNNSFFIIDAKTGAILVKKQLDMNVDVASTPLVTDSEIIFGTAQDGVVALNRNDLSIKWKFKTSPSVIYSSPYVRNPSSTVETSPVLSGENVYVPASDGYVYAINHKTGRLAWRFKTGVPNFSSVSISGNAMFVTDFAGNVYSFSSAK